MNLLACLLPASPPEPCGARVVRLLGGLSDEERRKANYEATVKWRSKNREKRNQNDREWRRRRRQA